MLVDIPANWQILVQLLFEFSTHVSVFLEVARKYLRETIVEREQVVLKCAHARVVRHGFTDL